MRLPKPGDLISVLALAALSSGCIQQEPTPRPSTAASSAPVTSVAPSPTSGDCADETQTAAVDPQDDAPRGLIDAADIITRGLTWNESWIKTGDGDRGTLPTIDDMPQLVVPEDTVMALRLTGDVAFTEFRAGVAITDRWPHRANEGNRTLRSDLAAGAPYVLVCVPSPPAGDWVMNARIVYELGRGYGEFYWRVMVQ